MVDVSNEKEVKDRKKHKNLERENELEEIRKILGTSQGKGFLWRLLKHCKVFDTISHHEPLAMSRMSGARDVGLWLIREIAEANPNGYLELVKEDRKRDERNNPQ